MVQFKTCPPAKACTPEPPSPTLFIITELLTTPPSLTIMPPPEKLALLLCMRQFLTVAPTARTPAPLLLSLSDPVRKPFTILNPSSVAPLERRAHRHDPLPSMVVNAGPFRLLTVIGILITTRLVVCRPL